MKTKILFIIAFVLSSSLVNSANAKNQNNKLSDIKISNSQSKDEREELHSIDLEKLYKDAENYYKLAKSWQKLKCLPKSGFICTKHECKRKDISAHIILDKKQKTVSRCENENCETFTAEFEQTGSFVNIQSKGPVGSLIRILGDSRYKEITTVGLDAYIANGNCEIYNEEDKKL